VVELMVKLFRTVSYAFFAIAAIASVCGDYKAAVCGMLTAIFFTAESHHWK
jgi:hypothetical protein